MTTNAVDARLCFLALARGGLLASLTGDVERFLGRASCALESFAADHASSYLKGAP